MNEIRFYLSLFLRRLPAFLLVAALVSAVSIIVLYLTIVACWLLYAALIAPRNKKA